MCDLEADWHTGFFKQTQRIKSVGPKSENDFSGQQNLNDFANWSLLAMSDIVSDSV